MPAKVPAPAPVPTPLSNPGPVRAPASAPLPLPAHAPAPVHGGNLTDAVLRFGRPRSDWLDLSTGINPCPYPAPALTPDAWHRLPEPDPALLLAAQKYYDAPCLLPVAGTQAAIQALPQLRAQSAGIAQVAVAGPTYAEHAHRWAASGHHLVACSHAIADLRHSAITADVLVVCQPNNPTGASVTPVVLLELHAQLAARGGWLIVDEAFGDTMPESSVAQYTDRPDLIVLKSVGKFFGLAGLRLGFVAAAPTLLAALAAYLGPWQVSGPAMQIGRAALDDRTWQAAMRQTLATDGARLRALLAKHGMQSHGTPLFQWCPLAPSQAVHFWRQMAQQGVWVRLFHGEAAGIRLGLPGDESGWQRLETALEMVCNARRAEAGAA
jgi:cobalamin biosynthetic protein CobC